MKVLKGRTAIARGVIIFSAIVLALAVVLPVLADGPNGNGGKPNKSESSGQPAGGGQSGGPNRGQAGQAKVQPDKAGSQDNQGQGRSDQTGSRGEQGQGKALPDRTSSQDNPGQGRSDQAGSQGQQGQSKALPDRASSQDNPGQGRSDQAGSQGQQGQGKAQPDRASSRVDQAQARRDQAGSQGDKGRAKLESAGSQGKRDQARLRRSGSQGKKGRAKADLASSLPSLSQAESRARSEPRVDPVRSGLANTQTGRSRLQANQAPGPSVAFNASTADCNVFRTTGKPRPFSFPFSTLAQDGSTLTISNTRGLKNLRITVNGQRFQVSLDDQAASNIVDLDVSSALLNPATDDIIFTPLGKPGTCALVLLR